MIAEVLSQARESVERAALLLESPKDCRLVLQALEALSKNERISENALGERNIEVINTLLSDISDLREKVTSIDFEVFKQKIIRQVKARVREIKNSLISSQVHKVIDPITTLLKTAKDCNLILAALEMENIAQIRRVLDGNHLQILSSIKQILLDLNEQIQPKNLLSFEGQVLAYIKKNIIAKRNSVIKATLQVTRSAEGILVHWILAELGHLPGHSHKDETKIYGRAFFAANPTSHEVMQLRNSGIDLSDFVSDLASFDSFSPVRRNSK